MLVPVLLYPSSSSIPVFKHSMFTKNVLCLFIPHLIYVLNLRADVILSHRFLFGFPSRERQNNLSWVRHTKEKKKTIFFISRFCKIQTFSIQSLTYLPINTIQSLFYNVTGFQVKEYLEREKKNIWLSESKR